MASRAAKRGDLKAFHRHLVKSFLRMPACLRQTTLGCETLGDIVDSKYYIYKNLEMDQRLRDKMAWYYNPLTLITFLPELLGDLFDEPHTTCFEMYLEWLRDISKTT